MWHRTPTYPPQQQYERRHIEEQSLNPRPGQIYLNSYKQLNQQNLQIIRSIKQLKTKNQQMNLRIEEKLKLSRRHLERHSYPNQTDKSQEAANPERYLHNKVYRKHESPLKTAVTQMEVNATEKLKEQQRFSPSVAIMSKQRNNSAYRIIMESHLRSLEQMEKEESQNQTKKAEKKRLFLEQDYQLTSQKNINNKYSMKMMVNKQIETPVKRLQLNSVYLRVTKEKKQQLIEKHNKQISQLKPQPPPRKPKDNSPYKVNLKRSKEQHFVYYTEQRFKEMYVEEEKAVPYNQYSKKLLY